MAHTFGREGKIMSRMTQKERLLQWFRDYGSITRAEAFTELGIVEMPARICELERMGYVFERETVFKKNRYGENVCFTKYTLWGRKKGQNNGKQ